MTVKYVFCYVSVNDGSGKVPAYRGLVDAVQSIVRADGVKGLYQVSFVFKIHACKASQTLLEQVAAQ